MRSFFVLLFFGSAFCWSIASGLLYPQQNEARGLDSLDGLWTFVLEPATNCADCESLGVRQKWYARDLSKFKNSTRIPVPTAYNELFAERQVREHVGWVWYQKVYRVSRQNSKSRLVLRFGSVQYRAKVFVNDKLLVEHIGGHLPFEAELPPPYLSNQAYVITVAVDNQLNGETVPPGYIFSHKYQNSANQTKIFIEQKPNFDFFNYAGILRSVEVQVLGDVFVKELQIRIEKQNSLNYNLQLSPPKFAVGKGQLKVILCLFDENQTKIECIRQAEHFQPVSNVQLWWPRGMGRQTLYTLEVSVYLDAQLVDVYRETFGFRWVELKDKQIYINDKEFYCVGFGMHEDFFLHGRGFDPVVMTRDLNMFEWINANCYRTSHYPYNELRAYEADRRGIVVITEVPAVGIFTYNDKTLKLHSQAVMEMIQRDYNHPSVIAWSLANEPVLSDKDECTDYYRKLTQLTRTLDASRPLAIVFGTNSGTDKVVPAAQFVDLIGLNTYPGWYNTLSVLETIPQEFDHVVRSWNNFHPNKTFILTEYGAEALPGYYSEPSIIFSEQYQIEVLDQAHRAIDVLRREKLLTGEMLWNFADFMTAASRSRPFGNHKGVLTRDRQPKMAAYELKKRYGKLGEK